MILALLTAFLVLFINYCIGKPSGEFSPYEIFSSYTVWLSKRRLKEVGLYETYWKQCVESYKRVEKKSDRITLKNDMAKIYYEAADPFFTWERAAGMCPVCFGVWISILISFSTLLLNENLLSVMMLTKYFTLNLLMIIVTSHVIIRLLNKII